MHHLYFVKAFLTIERNYHPASIIVANIPNNCLGKAWTACDPGSGHLGCVGRNSKS